MHTVANECRVALKVGTYYAKIIKIYMLLKFMSSDQ